MRPLHQTARDVPHLEREVDRNLYTGQNPMSSEALANRLVADLDAPSP